MAKKTNVKYDLKLIEALKKLPPLIEDKRHGFVIQIRDDMTAKEIHILTRNIQTRIYEECSIVMTIGIYAANDQEKYLKIKKTLTEILKENKDIIQMHGFYVDENTNVITFDLIFDFKCQNSEEVVTNIKNELKEKYPKYDFNIIIDLDLSD